MAKLLRKVGQILSGFYLLMLGEKTEKSLERKGICLECEKRRYLACGECGCIISAKVLIEEEECPIGKW